MTDNTLFDHKEINEVNLTGAVGLPKDVQAKLSEGHNLKIGGTSPVPGYSRA